MAAIGCNYLKVIQKQKYEKQLQNFSWWHNFAASLASLDSLQTVQVGTGTT